jgi:hypothetical protein
LSKQDIEKFEIVVPTLDRQFEAVFAIKELLKSCDELASAYQAKIALQLKLADSLSRSASIVN